MYTFVRIDVREFRLGLEETRDVEADIDGANAGAYRSGTEVVLRRDGAMNTR